VLRSRSPEGGFGPDDKGSVPMAKLQNRLVGYRAECGETTALSEALAPGSGIPVHAPQHAEHSQKAPTQIE
jgi:hypothetical protein